VLDQAYSEIFFLGAPQTKLARNCDDWNDIYSIITALLQTDDHLNWLELICLLWMTSQKLIYTIQSFWYSCRIKLDHVYTHHMSIFHLFIVSKWPEHYWGKLLPIPYFFHYRVTNLAKFLSGHGVGSRVTSVMIVLNWVHVHWEIYNPIVKKYSRYTNLY